MARLMGNWRKTPADRARDQEVYGDPVYLRNRAYVLRRAAGACEQCGRRNRKLQADHITPVTKGGTHAVENLKVLCAGPGSCHAKKTAQEGDGYRRSGRRAPQGDPGVETRTKW